MVRRWSLHIVLVVLSILLTVHYRGRNVDEFQHGMASFRSLEIEIRYDDALSDELTCSSTALCSLSLKPNSTVEFEGPGPQPAGTFDGLRVAKALYRLHTLQSRVPRSSEPSHTTGVVAVVNIDGGRWKVPLVGPRLLSQDEYRQLFQTGALPDLDHVQSHDLKATFVYDCLRALDPETRDLLSLRLSNELEPIEKREAVGKLASHDKTTVLKRLESPQN